MMGVLYFFKSRGFAMKYSDIIGVHEFFDDTFNMTQEKKGYWKRFISNQRFEDNLFKIINCLTSSEQNHRKSIWIQGTYGTGKSHSTSVIKHLLCDDYNIIKDYLSQISNIQTREKLDNFRKTKKVFSVVVKGRRGIVDVDDMIYVLQSSVTDTLRQQGIEILVKSDFDNMIDMVNNPKYSSFWANIQLDELRKYAKSKEQIIKELKNNNSTVLKILISELKQDNLTNYTKNIENWLIKVKEELVKQRIADYLMIFWDEFTSILDTTEKRGLLNTIQDIAELSKEEGVYVFIVSHKNLEATESYKELKENEKNMAKARFIPLSYDMQPITTYHILSNAILKKDEIKLIDLQVSNINNRISVVETLNNITQDLPNATSTKEKIKEIYPIHPYTAYLATFVSRNIGSAERSIFNFLNDSDKGFKKFIEYDIESINFLTADYVWDFFLNTFEEESANKFDVVINKYKMYLTKLKEKGSEYLAVFKVILLLNILYRVTATDGELGEKNLVNPSETNIISAFSGMLEREKVLEILNYIDENQIVHRNPDAMFEITFSSIPSRRIADEKRNIYPSNEDVTKAFAAYSVSCKKKVEDSLTGRILRESQVGFFWGGDNEFNIKNKVGSRFNVSSAISIAAFFFRGETKELEELLKRKERSIDNLQDYLLEMSKQEEYKNIVFTIIETPFNNKRFEGYLDSLASEAVARAMQLHEEEDNYRKKAEKWVKDWVTEITSPNSNAIIVFRGEHIRTFVEKVSERINTDIIKLIFTAGLEHVNGTSASTAWRRQMAKATVEKILFCNDRKELEEKVLIGQISYLTFLLKDNRGTYLFDQQLNLLDDADQKNPMVMLYVAVNNSIEKLHEKAVVNLGTALKYLRMPIYGYYPNNLCMGALALAFRSYIGKFFRAGNGQLVDKAIMRDIVVALFDYWENSKGEDYLYVRFSTEEERELVSILNQLFDIETNDSLISTKWKIRDKFELENGSPLWSLKYAVSEGESFNKLVDMLFSFVKKTDENISQEDIVQLLDVIKENKVEISQALMKVAGSKCIESYLAKLLKENDKVDISCISELIQFLNQNLSEKKAFWEEADVKDNTYRWQLEKLSPKPNNSDGRGNSHVNEKDSEFTPPPPDDDTKISRVKEKIKSYEGKVEKVKDVLIKLIEKYPYISDTVDELL